MGTDNSGSTDIVRRRRVRWHRAVPVLALAFQVVPLLLFWGIATSAFSDPRRLSESAERTTTLAALGFSAGAGTFLGSVGVYGLLTRARRITAAILIPVCCLPALLTGAFYFHGLLVFLDVV